ncbi:sialic acid binding Ig-like lectin 15, like [Toxotes jaculatrix]|uniref:sialic acid binding Ig-like lectin 15, like n=1 Tax=Toxotes jaculatrix TaxID=941984 RepID=UPI001B3AC0D7|nr:sialic acid binding Ig-like lectin 15, like [Toxotes jaculatrix]
MWQRTQSLCLILSVTITGSLSVSWNMVVSPVVTVSRGEDAVLSCSFTHPRQRDYSGLIAVKWLARERNASPFLACSVRNDSMEGGSCSSSALKHSLDGDPRRGELSLLIRKVQLNDEGVYFCRVELDNRYDQKRTELRVTAEPQILSLSVVETSSDSAPRRLQCEVEGHPLPKTVWLSASRRLIDDRGRTDQSGPYRQISSVPYLEEEVLTCRAENTVGQAERTYPPSPPSPPSPSSPPSNTLMITLVVCGLILLLLLLSAGVTVGCLRSRGELLPENMVKPQLCGGAEEGSSIADTARDDASPVYSAVGKRRGLRASVPPAGADTDVHVFYTAVTLTSSTTSRTEPAPLYENAEWNQPERTKFTL